jgi:hypothetical protein
MKVGIIAPPRYIEKIGEIIRLDFSEIEPINCAYSIYTEAVDIIKHYQPHMDAALFGGTMSYIVAKECIKPIIPWEYLPQNGSSLLRALLETSQLKYDICNASFDSYLLGSLIEAYAEIGISRDKLNIHLAERKPTSPGYLNYVYSFHEHLYRTGKVTCCLTALDYVFEKLRADKTPVIMIEHTANIIRETLKKLRLSYQVQVSQRSQIVALYIQITLPNESDLFSYDEYQQILDKMNVSKQIYLFAKRIQAAVIETGEKNYLLFTTRQLLEAETQQLTRINLFEMIWDNTDSTISIGIGYGNTAQEAKQNAQMGATKARSKGENKAYIVFNGKKIVGPINHSGADLALHNSKRDDRLQQIAEKAGVSINTIIRLHNIVSDQAGNIFTPRELSDLFGVTPRTMNRLIEKLENANACFVMGKKASTIGGRPSRIVQVNID